MTMWTTVAERKSIGERPLLRVALCGLLIGAGLIAWPGHAPAAAPARDSSWCTAVSATCGGSGQPYAEATLCARADVILCEDYNYPSNFYFSGTPGSYDSWWKNPAVANNPAVATPATCGKSDSGFSYASDGRLFPLASGYATKPQGASPSGSDPDYLYVANWDSSQGSVGPATIQGFLYINSTDSTYCNGLTIGKDFYMRHQAYLTTDYVFPGTFPKPDTYNTSVTPCLDGKFMGFYPHGGYEDPTSASYDGSWFINCSSAWVSAAEQGGGDASGSRFGDAINIRYGSGGACSYATFPAWTDGNGAGDPCVRYPQYIYNTIALNTDTNDQPVACTYTTAHYCTSGKLFRMSRGTWYTLELHYKLSSTPDALDGMIEFWVNGVRVYAADDLPTCNTSSFGDCKGLGYIQMLHYHNRNGCPESCADETEFDGQAVYDNLVIAQSYIGPPESGGGDTTPPAVPSGVSIVQYREGAQSWRPR